MDAQAMAKHPQRIRKQIVNLAIMTVIGVVLALIGPFGSFAMPLPTRLAAWLILAWAGYAIYAPMQVIVDRLHIALDLPRWGLWIGAVLVATLPMTALIWAIGSFDPADRLLTVNAFFQLYLYVLIIGGGVTALFTALGNRQPASVDAAQDPPADQPPVRFLDRLPPALGTQVIALEMEDHYVRAHTTLGSELILMRLSDAVGELDGIDGRQVHRSWWVARDAVIDVRRDGRTMKLLLLRDLEAPVARSRADELKVAGWF